MKKFLLITLSLVMLVSCSNDKTHVVNNNDRVALLEARVALNEANDGMLEARVTSLEIRADEAESRLNGLDSSLQSFMDQTSLDIQDLRDTDADLADRLDTHALAIGVLAGQIALLHAKDTVLNSKIESLKARVVLLENEIQAARQGYPNLDARLDAMQANIGTLNTKVASLQTNVAALNMAAALQMVANGLLQYQINQLNARVDQHDTNIAGLLSQMTSVTQTINSFSSIYLTQSAAQAYVSQLEGQLQAVNAIASAAVTPAQLQAAIDAIELIPGPQGQQGPAGLNGTNGTNGSVGATGPQGQPGINGSTAGMSAVKLCAADNATHPEYGFVVGDSIYAVYYGVVNGTLSAFLARLNPGQYVTTNDNSPCAFTVSYANGNSYLDGVQVNPVIPTTPSTPAGTCSISNRNQSDQSYQVTTSGTILNSNGKLEITLPSGASITGHNYSGGGATTSTVSGVWKFQPQAGVATSFWIYKSGTMTGATAKVTDGSGNVITCTVTN